MTHHLPGDRRRKQVTRLVLLILCVYAAPVIVYVSMFGLHPSADHARWAEFGSAMSGLYTPIVGLTTILLVARQLVLQAQVNALQAQANALQAQINTHQVDQSYIAQARAEIDLCSSKLAANLNEYAWPGITIREYLHRHFQDPGLNDLDAGEPRRLAASLDIVSPMTFSMWGTIYPVIAGLESKRDSFFEMTLASSLQRLAATLSFETCVCLENYYRVRNEGKLRVPYKFSPLVRSATVA